MLGWNLGYDPAPLGTPALSCVYVCSLFETQIIYLIFDGGHELFAIHGKDKVLGVRQISFYLLNEYGRIKAVETTY